MSERIDDGGPACAHGGNERQGASLGMSLRDYFAGQALVGLMSDVEWDDLGDTTCRAAYAIADTMIKVRRQPKGGTP